MGGYADRPAHGRIRYLGRAVDAGDFGRGAVLPREWQAGEPFAA